MPVDNMVAKLTSLDFLRAVYLNNELPLSVRMRAAGLAIPYELPKLSVIANVSNTNLGDRLERAIARSALSPGFCQLVIEAKAQVGDGVEPMGESEFKRRF
jgi:hypothetical protein